MTTQITVRIADDVAAFLDDQVKATGDSRASVVTRALRREQRRRNAEHDAAIYAAEGEDPEMVAIAEATSKEAGAIWADLD